MCTISQMNYTLKLKSTQIIDLLIKNNKYIISIKTDDNYL